MGQDRHGAPARLARREPVALFGSRADLPFLLGGQGLQKPEQPCLARGTIQNGNLHLKFCELAIEVACHQ